MPAPDHQRRIATLRHRDAQLRTFYSVGQAADLLGMSAMTLRRAINDGQFPAIRIRGRIIVPAKAIDELTERALEVSGLFDAAELVPGGA
ncbi:MAG TPA: helix-turn-helix domain-containing protein [Trebonia sp.]|jgi:excisionase family DNA binding protein